MKDVLRSKGLEARRGSRGPMHAARHLFRRRPRVDASLLRAGYHVTRWGPSP